MSSSDPLLQDGHNPARLKSLCLTQLCAPHKAAEPSLPSGTPNGQNVTPPKTPTDADAQADSGSDATTAKADSVASFYISDPISRQSSLVDNEENNNKQENGANGTAPLVDAEPIKLRHPKSQMAILIDSLFMILSGLYGIAIVVLGAVIPLTEIFVEEQSSAFEVFYIFLYGVSIGFLIYVYAYLLRRNRLRTAFLSRALSRSLSFTRSFSRNMARPDTEKGKLPRRFSMDQSNHHTGTFYLRLGVVGFGIGSMIHSGLNFGKFFGVSDAPGCSSPLMAIKPLLHLVFTFSQLYFIFMNSKMCIHRYKKLARFGLMHMAATNICVWFRCIVVETMHEIHHHHAHHHDDHHGESHDYHHATSTASSLAEDLLNTTVNVGRKLHAVAAAASINGNDSHTGRAGGLSEMECQWTSMMGKAVDAAAPYLYPCTIEFSLMCAGILYVMWANVGKRRRRRTDSEVEDEEEDLKHQRMSVDCTSSSRGLFLGILLTVAAIITIIAFYVLISQDHLRSSALLLTHLSETIIYLVTTFALIMACYRMKDMTFHHDHKSDIEETLILISYTGLLAFNIFSMIASVLHSASRESALTITSNFFMMVQSGCQTIFMLAGDRISAANKNQERKKPGREFVTFLLLCNFAMWILNTFETQKPEHNPLQVEFYGPEAWSIFSHISVPLGIYYRFHSTVCLSNIWKNAWKFRKHH